MAMDDTQGLGLGLDVLNPLLCLGICSEDDAEADLPN